MKRFTAGVIAGIAAVAASITAFALWGPDLDEISFYNPNPN